MREGEQRARSGSPQSPMFSVHLHNTAVCFVEHPAENLPNPLTVPNRCQSRFLNLRKAQQACAAAADCGGIGRDNGMACEGTQLQYELRRPGSLSKLPFVTSWVLHRNANASDCAARQIGPRLKTRQQWRQSPAHGPGVTRGGGVSARLSTADAGSYAECLRQTDASELPPRFAATLLPNTSLSRATRRARKHAGSRLTHALSLGTHTAALVDIQASLRV